MPNDYMQEVVTCVSETEDNKICMRTQESNSVGSYMKDG